MGSFANVQVTGVILDTKVLDKITAELRPKAAAIIETWGRAMTAEAQTRAPVKTGALRASLGNSHFEPPLTYVIQDGVEYGIYLEFGTSRMSARPFLIPAIEHLRDRFLDAFAELFK